MSSVAFRPDEFISAKRVFRGVIIAFDYGETPFGMMGNPDIQRRPQFCIKIESEQYAKPQYEWYVPTDKKLTKWWYFIQRLHETGALREILPLQGETEEERIKDFGNKLIGMEFDWEDVEVELMGGKKTFVLLPKRYYGKREAVAKQVKEEEIK